MTTKKTSQSKTTDPLGTDRAMDEICGTASWRESAAARRAQYEAGAVQQLMKDAGRTSDYYRLRTEIAKSTDGGYVGMAYLTERLGLAAELIVPEQFRFPELPIRWLLRPTINPFNKQLVEYFSVARPDQAGWLGLVMGIDRVLVVVHNHLSVSIDQSTNPIVQFHCITNTRVTTPLVIQTLASFAKLEQLGLVGGELDG